MKILRNEFFRKAALAAALLSIPATVYATFDSYGYFTTWAGVGWCGQCWSVWRKWNPFSGFKYMECS